MPLNILTFSSLYPSNAQPQHGVFVENRLRRIRMLEGVEARVVAPVPWFPLAGKRFGRYGAFSEIAPGESRYGIPIDHPRYPVIPKIGMSIAPWLMFQATKDLMTDLRDDAIGFDLIDAHYFYPDGVAASMLGRALGRPVVISARGTDVNLIPEFTSPRRQILQAAETARAIIAVSEALKRRMVDIGIAADKITVLRNGVDAEQFAPVDRDRVRKELGITRPTMVAVGNVLESKGQDIAIQALVQLKDMDLFIVGAGPDETKFASLAKSIGVSERVRFVGRVPHDELPRYFSAADVSVLASMREGWPNVLLESLACGTPVVASNVGAVPEIITSPLVGRIMAERTPVALANAIRDLRSQDTDRGKIRIHAEGFGWEETARAQAALYVDVAGAAIPPVGSPAIRRSYTGA